jgi:hypothetical protein
MLRGGALRIADHEEALSLVAFFDTEKTGRTTPQTTR